MKCVEHKRYIFFVPSARNHCGSNEEGGGRVVRWCWVKFPVSGRPTNLDNSKAWAYCNCYGCGWGCLDILDVFSLVCQFSVLPPSP